MGKVISEFTMSLDGFVAGPDDDVRRLFTWYFSGDTDFSLAGTDLVFRISRTSAALLQETWPTLGALVTGRRDFDVSRAWGGIEKGTTYYLQNDAFLIKMALLGLILILEVWPMATLIQWRIRMRRNELSDTGAAAAMARISWVQAGLVILMVFAATAMARGYGVQIW
jgi:hypothetical protein